MDVTPSRDDRLPDQPDDRDLEDGGLDLSPRPAGDARTRRGPGRRWGALGVLVVLAGALVFIVIQARGATVYFKNADEAVAEREELGTSRFRLQGTVVDEPNEGADDASYFTVAYGGVSVKVRHTGSEPAMFEAGIPVVAEGRWNADGTQFQSDRLLVKHDEDYKDYDDENPERVDPEQSTNR